MYIKFKFESRIEHEYKPTKTTYPNYTTLKLSTLVNKTIVAYNIKFMRQYWKMSQKAYSERLEINTGQLYTYESGRTPPNKIMLEKLASISGVPIDALERINLSVKILEEWPHDKNAEKEYVDSIEKLQRKKRGETEIENVLNDAEIPYKKIKKQAEKHKADVMNSLTSDNDNRLHTLVIYNLTESNRVLAEANKSLAESNSILANNNQELIVMMKNINK